MDAASSLARLSDELLEATSSADPFSASIFGVPGYDADVPDLSEAGEQTAAERLLDLATRAERIPAEALDDADRVTRAVLVHAARSAALPLADRHAEFTLSGHVSPTAVVFEALTNATLATPENERGYVSRVRGVAKYVTDARDRALAGAMSGRASTHRGIEQILERLRTYLASSLDDDVIVKTAQGTKVEGDVRALVTDSVRPAFADLVESLAGPLQEAARSDDDSGLVHLPDGQAMYARAVEAHTSTTRTPEEIHQLGLDICVELREEYAELGQRLFGTSDFDTIVDRLRHDPELRYQTAQQILDDARMAVARAEKVLGDWFGRTCTTGCTVEPIADIAAPTGPLGQYLPPAAEVGREGQYQVNTYHPHTRTRYEYETLAFHEAVPGHHLQFALAQELDYLPAFRQHLYIPAFGEGWGLYTERLADEMGLYSSDLYRFGMLSFDSWRACRLVVDTGIHLHGWSRQRAIDFMLANSAVTPENAVNEVDRYIALPGQALGYMVGRLEIQAARKRAEDRLGSAFDIRAFHDLVLSNGAVPMNVLATEVDRWIEKQ